MNDLTVIFSNNGTILKNVDRKTVNRHHLCKFILCTIIADI